MAIPTCPKCDNRVFAMTEIEPRNSNYKYNAIHCVSCGAVVGVMDYFNLGTLLQKIMRHLQIS